MERVFLYKNTTIFTLHGDTTMPQATLSIKDAIDWPRVEKALRQHQRNNGQVRCVPTETLQAVLALCGEQSWSRQNALRLGVTLQSMLTPTIIAPCCPDYGHDGTVYTFNGINGDASLIAQMHITFLKHVTALLPAETVCILAYADLEAADQAICNRVGVDQTTCMERIRASIEVTRRMVAGFGWRVDAMTNIFPNLERAEHEAALHIDQPNNQQRLIGDTLARQSLYERIGVCGIDAMRQRTIKTAAQYLAFGRLAQRAGMIVCNHSTINLSWYKAAEVPFLHNNVSMY